MTAIVTRGNAADLHLPDETVDLVVTSPPYFGLRSYQDGGEHYEGQVGDEATPTEYLDALIACTREWMRVLKPGGSIFVNLGDKYAGGGGQWEKDERPDPQKRRAASGSVATGGKAWGHKPKTLIGLPWRYAIRCIDELGLILRAEIVWAKPNGLPESVTDRVRRSHEQVFHFVKQPRYYSAVDEVREEATTAPRYEQRASGRAIPGLPTQSNLGKGGSHLTAANYNPLGKLPGSVWEIPTAPLKVPASLGIDHFAAYPPELVRRIVLGWSPREVCTACGEGRRPVVENSGAYAEHRAKVGNFASALYAEQGRSANSYEGKKRRPVDAPPTEKQITGYICACYEDDGQWNPSSSTTSTESATSAPTKDSSTRSNLLQKIPDSTSALNADSTGAPRMNRPPETLPGVVLDPFGGTGTTALVASAFGRVGISVDLSADYCRLAQWRTTDPGERARALGVAKPPQQVDGQLGMFEGIGA